MRVIAVMSTKGGVAKTTTAVNLAAAAVKRGKRVLLLDIDSQGSASRYLVGGSTSPGTADWLEGSHPATACTYVARDHEAGTLHLMPGNTDLILLQREFFPMNPWPAFLIKDKLAQLNGYDYIFIDCHPSEGPLELAAAVAADLILSPMTLEPLSSVGVEDLQRFIENWGRMIKMPPVLYVPSKFDGRVQASQKMLTEMTKAFGSYPEGIVAPPTRYAAAYVNGSFDAHTIYEIEGSSADRAKEDFNTLYSILESYPYGTR